MITPYAPPFSRTKIYVLTAIATKMTVVATKMTAFAKPLGFIANTMDALARPMRASARQMEVLAKPLTLIAKHMTDPARQIIDIAKHITAPATKMAIVAKGVKIVAKRVGFFATKMEVLATPVEVLAKRVGFFAIKMNVVARPLKVFAGTIEGCRNTGERTLHKSNSPPSIHFPFSISHQFFITNKLINMPHINDEFAHEVRRCNNGYQYLVNKTGIFGGYRPFQNQWTLFQDNRTKLSQLLPELFTDGPAITDDKGILKHKAADALGTICEQTHSFALSFGETELAAITNIHSAGIFKKKDSEILPFARKIADAITPFFTNADFADYEITDHVIAAAVTDAGRFNDKLGVAQTEDQSFTVTSEEAVKVIHKLRENYHQFDLLSSKFDDSDPEFVRGLHLAIAVNNAGIRHSGIEGFIKDAHGNPVVGATITFEGTLYTATSDLFGKYRLVQVKPDDYVVKVSAPGFAPATLVHHVSRGHIDEIDFQLQAQ